MRIYANKGESDLCLSVYDTMSEYGIDQNGITVHVQEYMKG